MIAQGRVKGKTLSLYRLQSDGCLDEIATNTSIGRFGNYEQSGGRNGIDPATRSYAAVVDRSFSGQQIPITVISEGVLPYAVSMGQGKSRSHRKALQSLDTHQCPAM
jgi:hypothetical protein